MAFSLFTKHRKEIHKTEMHNLCKRLQSLMPLISIIRKQSKDGEWNYQKRSFKFASQAPQFEICKNTLQFQTSCSFHKIKAVFLIPYNNCHYWLMFSFLLLDPLAKIIKMGFCVKKMPLSLFVFLTFNKSLLWCL